MMRSILAIVLGFLIALLTPALASAVEPATAFVDVSVVPMDMDNERVLAHQTVLVREGRISKIGSAAQVKLPAGCVVIDGRDRYLIPGLVDSHVHFYGPGVRPDDRPLQRVVLTMLLANGVTTAVNMLGSPEILALRGDVAAGREVGPRIYTTGTFIEQEHAYVLGSFLQDLPTFHTPDEVRKEVAAQKQAGYDFVKIHGDLPQQTYDALLDAGRQQGIRIVGHLPSNLGIDAALKGHQALIVHAEEYLYSYFQFHRDLPTDPAEIDRMVREISTKTKDAGTWVSPTLSVFRQIIFQVADLDAVLHRPEMAYMPERATSAWRAPQNPYVKHWPVEKIPYLRAQYGVMQKLVRGLHDAGVPLLAGTDPFVPCVLPGFAMKAELEQLVEAGLSPYEALQTATSNGARFLNASGEFGAVAPGVRADLVLVSANPLENIDNVFRQDGLMVGGRWFSAEELQTRLAMAAKAAGN